MNGIIVKKLKWLIIATLAVLVVGMTLFGIFGFNNTADYSNGCTFDIVLNQPLEDAQELMAEKTNEYLAQKGIVGASVQQIDNGKGLTYTFTGDVSAKLADLEKTVNDALEAMFSAQDVSATVKISPAIKGYGTVDVVKMLIALGVGLVAIFIYTIIMEKGAGALAVSGSYLLAMLVFIALMGLTRLPAMPLIETSTVIAAVLAAALSISTVNRLKEQEKNFDGKVDYDKLAVTVINAEKKKYLLTLVVALVATIALSALFVTYATLAGAQILFAGISATMVAYFFTPLVWTAIKAKKKK